MAEGIRWAFAALLVLETAIEGTLGWLNLRRSAKEGAAVPQALVSSYTAEEARRSQAYVRARGRLDLLSLLLGALLLSGVMLSGALGGWEAWIGQHLASWAQPHRFVVFLVGLTIPFGLLGLPLSLYRTFGIEARFGFNKLTFALWLRDRLKGLALAAVLGLPLLYAVWGFMALTGPVWWLWLFAFLAVWQLILFWLYPAVIARWFNRFTPLAEGELRSRVESLAIKAGFRMGGIFVMDAGQRSTHSNAYFTGLVRPRIVLFDTLLKSMSTDETEAVLAHEIGHWRGGHIRRMILLTLALQLAGLYILSWAIAWPPLFAAFGLSGPSPYGAVALAALAGGTATFWLGPLLARLSRRHEYEADAYSRSLVGRSDALKTALIKLGRENLTNLAPHPWYSAYHYSHPTLPERLAALEANQ